MVSAGESAIRAPYLAKAYAAEVVRLNTVSSWPAAIRHRAIGAPICPIPINPIFIFFFGRLIDLSRRVAGVKHLRQID